MFSFGRREEVKKANCLSTVWPYKVTWKKTFCWPISSVSDLRGEIILISSNPACLTCESGSASVKVFCFDAWPASLVSLRKLRHTAKINQQAVRGAVIQWRTHNTLTYDYALLSDRNREAYFKALQSFSVVLLYCIKVLQSCQCFISKTKMVYFYICSRIKEWQEISERAIITSTQRERCACL